MNKMVTSRIGAGSAALVIHANNELPEKYRSQRCRAIDLPLPTSKPATMNRKAKD